MKGYIIEKYNNMNNSYVSTRLVEEAKILGIDLKIIGVKDTIIYENELYNRAEKIDKCDFVINRYKWGKTKDFLNTVATKSYNDIDAFNLYVNKYEQLRRLDSKYMDKPKYILSDSTITYNRLANILGERVVVKGLENSMGREIFLIDNENDMKNLQNYGKEKEWLFEEYVSSSYGKDMRVYSIKGEVVACIIRQSKDDFRANIALGAIAIECAITEEVRNIAKDIYEQTKLDFVGIDLMFGSENMVFCEINVMAGFEGVESATGKNIAKRIISMIYEECKGE